MSVENLRALLGSMQSSGLVNASEFARIVFRGDPRLMALYGIATGRMRHDIRTSARRDFLRGAISVLEVALEINPDESLEERALRVRFGASYEAYLGSVRRWI